MSSISAHKAWRTLDCQARGCNEEALPVGLYCQAHAGPPPSATPPAKAPAKTGRRLGSRIPEEEYLEIADLIRSGRRVNQIAVERNGRWGYGTIASAAASLSAGLKARGLPRTPEEARNGRSPVRPEPEEPGPAEEPIPPVEPAALAETEEEPPAVPEPTAETGAPDESAVPSGKHRAETTVYYQLNPDYVPTPLDLPDLSDRTLLQLAHDLDRLLGDWDRLDEQADEILDAKIRVEDELNPLRLELQARLRAITTNLDLRDPDEVAGE